MSNQLRGTTTNMTKLVAWDIDEYLSYSDEDDCNVCLSPAEKYLIRCTLRAMKWETRWTSEIGTEIPDISNIAENLAYKMGDQNCCDICPQVADCIETSQDVIDALNYFNQSNRGFLTPSDNIVGQETQLIDPEDCSLDEMWGNAVALWGAINQVTVDMLETLSEATNGFEVADKIVSAVPVLNQLPVDEMLGFVSDVGDWLLENYNSALTLTLEQRIQCDLFCIMATDCTFSFDQLLSYFSDYFEIDLNAYQLSNMIGWLTGVTAASEQFVYALSAFQLWVVGVAAEFFGIGNRNFYALQAQLGTPDNDWSILCDCVDIWIYDHDFAVSEDGWYPFSATGTYPFTAGVWVDGEGFETTDYRSAVNNYERQTSAEIEIDVTNVTRVSFTFDVVKGIWQAASQTMLAIRCYNDVGTIIASHDVNRGDVTDGDDLGLGLDLDADVAKIRVLVRPSTSITGTGNLTGSALIKTIHVEGTGINPFI